MIKKKRIVQRFHQTILNKRVISETTERYKINFIDLTTVLDLNSSFLYHWNSRPSFDCRLKWHEFWRWWLFIYSLHFRCILEHNNQTILQNCVIVQLKSISSIFMHNYDGELASSHDYQENLLLWKERSNDWYIF